MAIRTISNAGGSWYLAGTWVEGIVPTAADDVRATTTSGNINTSNGHGYCRSLDLTGYTKTLTHMNYSIYIGDATLPPNNIAIKLAGTYVQSGNLGGSFTFCSTNTQVQTIDYGGFTVSCMYINGLNSSYKFLSNTIIAGFGAGNLGIQLVGATLDFNNLTHSIFRITDSGAVPSTYILGSSTITITNVGTQTLNLTAYSVWPANTAKIIFLSNGNSAVSCIDNFNFNGTSFVIKSVTYGFTNSCTIKNLTVAKTCAVALTVGKTLTVTGEFLWPSKTGVSSFSGGTVVKTSGIVDFYAVTFSSIILTGGAQWRAFNNCTVISSTGITSYGGDFCLDPENGNDSIVSAYGWWKVDYTNSLNICPIKDERGVGSISGASCKIMGLIDQYDWSEGSGTLYFYRKEGTFQNETITFTNGGTMSITGDLQISAWKTPPTTLKHSPGDRICFCKGPEPINTGQNALWTSTIIRGGGMGAYITPTSSSNTSPIIITKALHGFFNGDIVCIQSHTGNLAANGVWTVTKITDNTFSLNNSTGSGVGGATGQVYPFTSKAVILTTPVTTTICDCNLPWTVGTNVTSAIIQVSYYKLGIGSPAITTNASCGANQILAKYGLPASLDLSSKKQISFWFRTNNTYLANNFLLKLYSDSACTIEVESFSLPAYPMANFWYPMTINKGAALSSTVQGIALYTTVAQPSRIIYIDNIMACKDAELGDSISLQSLISKNITDQHMDDVFVGIQSINGNIIILDGIIESTPLVGRGYYGVTESVPLYKKETQKTPSNLYLGTLNKGGISGNTIKYLGGYDKALNIQNGRSTIDGLIGAMPYIYSHSFSNVDIKKFQFLRFSYGAQYSPGGGIMEDLIYTNCGYSLSNPSANILWTLNNIKINACSQGVYAYTHPSSLMSNIMAYNCTGYGANIVTAGTISDITCNNTQGIFISNYSCLLLRVKSNYSYYGLYINSGTIKIIIDDLLECNNNNTGIAGNATVVQINKIWSLDGNTYGADIGAHSWLIKEIVRMNNNANGIRFLNASFNCKIYKITEANANGYSVVHYGNDNYIYNATLTNSTGVYNVGFSAGKNYLINCTFQQIPLTQYANVGGSGLYFCVHNYNNVLDDHRIYSDGGSIVTDKIERHSVSGISWKFSVIAVGRDIVYPLILQVAKILCTAGVPKTIGIWCKKSHATDIGGRLVIMGGKFEGVGSPSSDVFTEVVNVTEWQQISMSFTPTKTEVIEVEFWAYWQANLADEFIWIDDISII